MAVVSAKVKYASGTGTGELTGDRSYTLVYEVWTDSATDGVMTVGNAGPQKGSFYTYNSESDPGALCVSVTPRQIQAKLWEVTCQYKSKHGDKEKNNASNPLNQPAKRRWESVSVTTYPDADLDGEPYVNSAGHRYEADAVATDEEHMVLTVTRNESYFDFATASYFQNAINSDTFYGWAPKTAKVSITSEEQFSDDMAYVTTTYRIEFNATGWQRRLLDEGPFSLKSGSLTRIYPVDDNGVASTASIKLDGAGGKLSETATPVWKTFKRYKEVAFSGLNL